MLQPRAPSSGRIVVFGDTHFVDPQPASVTPSVTTLADGAHSNAEDGEDNRARWRFLLSLVGFAVSGIGSKWYVASGSDVAVSVQ